jgi:hypothetical protein
MAGPPETTEENGNAPEVIAGETQEASTQQAEVGPAVANFRKGSYTEMRYGLLIALGEEPREYQQMMESQLEDLQPRPGLETHLAKEIGETFWRMQRIHRMRDGLALKSIQKKVQGEEMVANMQASKVFELVEPFARLKEALAHRQGPTAEEIDGFVQSRKGEDSEGVQELIVLLNSLKHALEEAERKAALLIEIRNGRGVTRDVKEIKIVRGIFRFYCENLSG